MASLFVALAVMAFNGCGDAPRDQHVQAAYDKTTGKLSQLTVDVSKDGKPNITSYMDGPKFLRIEIDTNEDGRIDRYLSILPSSFVSISIRGTFRTSM